MYLDFRILDKLNEIKIPKVQLLDGSYMDYDEYQKQKNKKTTNKEIPVITDEMLPF